MTKVWFEGQKIYTIIFTEEDLIAILKILENLKGNKFIAETEKEKLADRLKTRIYFQMQKCLK